MDRLVNKMDNIRVISKKSQSLIEDDEYHLDFILNILEKNNYKDMNLIRLNNCIDQNLSKDKIIDFIQLLKNTFEMYAKNIKNKIDIKRKVSKLMKDILKLRKDYFSKCSIICYYFNKVNNHVLTKDMKRFNLKKFVSESFENIIYMEPYCDNINIIDQLYQQINKKNTFENICNIHNICSTITKRSDLFGKNIISDVLLYQFIFKINELILKIYDKIVFNKECENYDKKIIIEQLYDYLDILIKYPNEEFNEIYDEEFNDRFLKYWKYLDKKKTNDIISIEMLLLEILNKNEIYSKTCESIKNKCESIHGTKKKGRNVCKYLDPVIWNLDTIDHESNQYNPKTTIMKLDYATNKKYTLKLNLIHYKLINEIVINGDITFTSLIRQTKMSASEINVQLNTLISTELIIRDGRNFRMNKEFSIKNKNIDLLAIDDKVSKYLENSKNKSSSNKDNHDKKLNDDDVDVDELDLEDNHDSDIEYEKKNKITNNGEKYEIMDDDLEDEDDEDDEPID